MKLLQRITCKLQCVSQLILRDYRTQTFNNIATLSTILILILFVSLITNIMTLSPIIYLIMNEQSLSETDLLITSSPLKSFPPSLAFPPFTFLDYKTITHKFCNQHLQGCSSRFTIHAKHPHPHSQSIISSDVLFIDIQKENTIHLGRHLQLHPLQQNQCYISTQLYLALTKHNENTPQNSKSHSDIQLEFTFSSIFNSLQLFPHQIITLTH